jgi:gas vesicle protein
MFNREDEVQLVADRIEDRGHPLAIGLLAGAAVGVGLGLLFAPRKGSEVRHQLADRAKHVASSSHDAYGVCRDAVRESARRTGRQVRDLADTVTRKARRASPVEAPGAPVVRIHE